MQYHISRVLGGLLILVGVAVFLIRLHHAGPYAMPGGGNLIAGVLALAELEEVISIKAFDRDGKPANLRLWVVDYNGRPWVTMPGSKSDNHGLEEGPVAMLRGGVDSCVVATRLDDRAAVNNIHRRRHEKYMIQRLATRLGIFGETAGAQTVTLRLDPCP